MFILFFFVIYRFFEWKLGRANLFRLLIFNRNT